MSGDPFCRARKCCFESVCLSDESDHPACEVIDAVGYNLMFVHNKKKRKCRYCMQVGGSEICTCPTHFYLHEKRRCSKLSPVFSYSVRINELLDMKNDSDS